MFPALSYDDEVCTPVLSNKQPSTSIKKKVLPVVKYTSPNLLSGDEEQQINNCMYLPYLYEFPYLMNIHYNYYTYSLLIKYSIIVFNLIFQVCHLKFLLLIQNLLLWLLQP